MNRLVRMSSLLATSSLAAASAASPLGVHSPALQGVVDAAVQGTVESFAARQLASHQVAVTLVDLADPRAPRFASHRGEVPIYPASVVKLFYLAAAHRWLEDRRLQDTPELRRALRDMIVDSYNEATHYVVDCLTGTTSGPELSDDALAGWQEQRNAVNRYFAGLGYTGINVNKKPWCEGPYGRETQAIQAFEPKRNLLTTEATARLVVEIATGQAVSPERSREMLALLERRLADPTDQDPEGQARFIGPALPAGSRLWSKAGWTSETRHDAALVELPGGRRVVLVLFTEHHANERGILHRLARSLVAGLSPAAPAP